MCAGARAPSAARRCVLSGALVLPRCALWQAKLLGVPIGIFDTIVNGLQWASDKVAGLSEDFSEKLADAAEFGRIGRYYAVVDMLTTDEADKYGRITLREHYQKVATEGQEYDPYTSVFGNKGATDKFKEGAGK